MREPDGTQLPVVEAFGAELERAMANRGASRWRSQRRVLATACAAGLVAVSLLTAPGRAASGAVGEWLGLAEPGDPPTVDVRHSRGGVGTEPTGSVVVAAGRAPTAPATSSFSRASPSRAGRIRPPRTCCTA